jgi:cytochrome c oxidase cbb3-type subunit 4
MEVYTALRHFADSWGLLVMFIGLGAIFVWTLRPGARQAHEEAALQIFRNEDAPKADAEPAPRRGSDTAVQATRPTRPDSMS